jgi:hypothetical protein
LTASTLGGSQASASLFATLRAEQVHADGPKRFGLHHQIDGFKFTPRLDVNRFAHGCETGRNSRDRLISQRKIHEDCLIGHPAAEDRFSTKRAPAQANYPTRRSHSKLPAWQHVPGQLQPSKEARDSNTKGSVHRLLRVGGLGISIVSNWRESTFGVRKCNCKNPAALPITNGPLPLASLLC